MEINMEYTHFEAFSHTDEWVLVVLFNSACRNFNVKRLCWQLIAAHHYWRNFCFYCTQLTDLRIIINDAKFKRFHI